MGEEHTGHVKMANTPANMQTYANMFCRKQPYFSGFQVIPYSNCKYNSRQIYNSDVSY